MIEQPGPPLEPPVSGDGPPIVCEIDCHTLEEFAFTIHQFRIWRWRSEGKLIAMLKAVVGEEREAVHQWAWRLGTGPHVFREILDGRMKPIPEWFWTNVAKFFLPVKETL